MNGKYDDIIGLPAHKSKTHPPMSRLNRAAQFSPFAALTGYDDEIDETSRVTDRKIELENEQREKINESLCSIKSDIRFSPSVYIEYFVSDESKDGGRYISFTGNVRKIDEYSMIIYFTDGTEIAIDDIFRIEYEPLKSDFQV